MAKTIMVIDDSATMLMSLTNSLEIAGYTVLSASDGAIALDKLKKGAKPDLIITDINMPNMGGIEFIGKARSLGGFRFTPILALTTESQQGTRDEAKKLGATGWLLKPVSGTDLNKIIKQVLPGA
jgi:two-component system chemotaxis response regulator CheY